MTEDELIRAAYSNTDKMVLPDGMMTHDELFYWRMREIYRMAKAGTITAEQGAEIKKMQILYYRSRKLRSDRIGQILKIHAGADECNDDGYMLD